jgi:sulfur carrier protein ThiS
MSDHIEVKVGRLPGRIETIGLNGDRKVSTALEAAGLDAEGYEVRVNGNPASMDTELTAGQTVLLTQKIKGNADDHIEVKVGRLPGRIETIALNGDRRVSTALEAAGLDAEGYEVRVNGNPASMDTDLTAGQTVLLTQKIKGNEG